MTNREQKSKVMALGNRLASHMGGDRSAAFVQAWAIVKAGGLELAVRGVSFGNRQEALKRLAAYNPAEVRAVLVRTLEPSRPGGSGCHGRCSERPRPLPARLRSPRIVRCCIRHA